MSKALKRLALALLAASLCAAAAAAQETPAPAPTPEWVAVSPAGEEFAALMPKEPLWLEQDEGVAGLVATGRRYTATADGARYVVWSLTSKQNAGGPVHLDLVAEVAWELLVRPEFERLEAEKLRTGTLSEFSPQMSYARGFELGGRPAREYSVKLEKAGGPVYISADGGRLYVAAALAPDPLAAGSRRFVESFAVGTKTPNPPAEPATAQQASVTGGGTGMGLGGGVGAGGPLPDPNAPVDYARPFRQNEVTKKAIITYKPEPGFTDGARKFSVTGVVRLRVILHSSGEMRNISVVKGLPHGLTEKAITAARAIRFEPAQKDGRAVSQYAVLDYNFNIY